MTNTQDPIGETWARRRLDEIKAGSVDVPLIVETLQLGLLDDWAPGWVTKRWAPKPELLHADGSKFGGYTAALADQMLSFAAMTVIPHDKAFRTINLSLQFFKLSHAEELVIEGHVVAQSKRIISIEVTFCHPDETLVAKATGQQAVISFPGSREEAK